MRAAYIMNRDKYFLISYYAILFVDSKVYLPVQQAQAEQVPWGINAINALDVSDEYANNTKICIVDSGYDLGHQDLPSTATGAIITGQDNGVDLWYKDGSSGHGTHVAGIIASIAGNGKGGHGVIRNGRANLHIIRVFNNEQQWVWNSFVRNAVSIACITYIDIIFHM